MKCIDFHRLNASNSLPKLYEHVDPVKKQIWYLRGESNISEEIRRVKIRASVFFRQLELGEILKDGETFRIQYIFNNQLKICILYFYLFSVQLSISVNYSIPIIIWIL